MSTLNTRAIVVQRRPDRQDDCLITLFTKQSGIVYARAKSAYKAKSKLRAHMEPLKEVDVMYSDTGHIKTLAQIVTRKSLHAEHPTVFAAQVKLLRTAIECVGVASYDMVIAYLSLLKQSQNKKHMQRICTAALLHVAQYAGCGMHSSSCAQCGKTSSQRWYMSARLGGFACERCADEDAKIITPAVMAACSMKAPEGIALPYIVDHLRWHTHKKLSYLSDICLVEKHSATE